MHGYSHLYERQTNKKDIFNYGGGSEFFGLDYENQLNKIKSGLEKFREKNVSIRSFFAPNHTYDSNTLKALDKSGIRIGVFGLGIELSGLVPKKLYSRIHNFLRKFLYTLIIH